jgi:GTPase-activator protein for Ras-like GTPase/C2 domain
MNQIVTVPGARNKMPKSHSPVFPERRLADSRRSSSAASLGRDAAIIKVGKLLLWDSKMRGSQIRGKSRSRGEAARNCWRKVSCILQENGELKLYAETDVSVLSAIQLSQLSRCAVQKLDRSVLDEDYCIAIYPQYTATSTSISLIHPVFLCMENRVLFEVWLVLLRAFTIPQLYGPAQSSPVFDPSSSGVLRGLFGTSTTNMFRVEKTLKLRIVEAKLPQLGLPATGDYFAEVVSDGEIRAKTSVKEKTTNPFWRADFEFSDLPAVVSTTKVVLKSRDGGRSHFQGDILGASTTATVPEGLRPSVDNGSQGVDVTYGSVDIHLDDLAQGKEQETWWPLVNDNGSKVGEIQLKVELEELVVLMSQDYQALSDILHDFSTSLTLEIAALSQADLRRIAEILLNIFQVTGKASDWILALVEEEIDGVHKESPAARLMSKNRTYSNDSEVSASDREAVRRDMGKSAQQEAHLLFRGNSLLTKALDAHMTRLGKEYLEECFAHIIRDIVDKDIECEVDPMRVTDPDDLRKNWKLLLSLTRSLWASIYASAPRCPPELRMIFRHIKACAEDRYGSYIRSVQYSSVSGFLFLRFFCPAVLNPKLFGLLRDHPKQKAQRTLTLIAKSLQGLANMTSFGAKEPWMEPMNRFLNASRQEFKSFINSVCSISIDSGLASVVPPSYATPITILARLPPTSKEGFPSLPYLIDHPKNFAALVQMWTEPTNIKKHEHILDGNLLRFHRICLSLQQRAKECLETAEQAERPSSSLSFKLEGAFTDTTGNSDSEESPLQLSFPKAMSKLVPADSSTPLSQSWASKTDAHVPSEIIEGRLDGGYDLSGDELSKADYGHKKEKGERKKFIGFVPGFRRKVKEKGRSVDDYGEH